MKIISFFKDSPRFALAIIVNIVALMLAIYWLVDSNILSGSKKIELEPIVTSITLIGTLLGLNYVNDKLTRPDVRFKISTVIAHPPYGDIMDGISIDIQNHSIQKLFIDSFFIKLVNQSNKFAFVRNGFTKEILGKVCLEPGQAFTLVVDKDTIVESGLKLEDVGDFVIRDQVGREYVSSVGVMASHMGTLLNKT